MMTALPKFIETRGIATLGGYSTGALLASGHGFCDFENSIYELRIELSAIK